MKERKIQMQRINLYQCEPNFRTLKRNFDYHYFLYVHRGKGEYHIGSNVFQAARGDIFYCPPGVDNIISADDREPFLLSGLEIVTDQPLQKVFPMHMNLLGEPFLMELIRQMVEEYAYGRMYSEQICNQLLDVFLMELERYQKTQLSEHRELTQNILDYMKDNIQRPIYHEELERVFSYHRSSINRILLEATGMTLKNYQIDLRVKKASELLKYSNRTIREISELCGYKSPVFFSRQYKEKTGMTPGEYRKADCKGGFVS